MDANLLYERAWNELSRAVAHRRHPFHTCCLATVRKGIPQARIVVLRYAEQNTVGCHADVRSPKAQEASEMSSWLFYSFPDKLQIRATGRSKIHHLDDTAAEAWAGSQLLSRRCYLAPYAPGASMSEASRNMPPGLEDREPTEEESQLGFKNFCVIRTQIETLEVLSLEFEGNLRCCFTGHSHQWLAP
jgi:pyridoxamine 5'-phosphate oxidase